MATQLFFGSRDGSATTHLGTNVAKLNGSGSGWRTARLHTARGSALTSTGSNTVAGPTNGIETGQEASGLPYSFISPPVSADVTISGTITFNLWAFENSMSANSDVQCVIEVIRATDNSLDTIINSERNVELGTTSAANNWTGTPTSTVVNRGDRIRARVAFNDQTTMASGFVCDFDLDGAAGTQGDSYITFTETFTFESNPSGTTIYLTNTASDVSTASVDREAWTSRGGGVVDDVTNTAAGWTAPIQVTDTAGGTVVDWFTKRLTAFTLGGMAQANIRAKDSADIASLKVEIARVDSDGTNPTVWGSWCIDPGAAGQSGALSSAGEAARTCWVSGDDLAVSDGQRLRIRLYVDDNAFDPLTAGQTVTTYYNGTSGGASGDSYVILPQSVSEFSPATLVLENGYVDHANPGLL